MRNSSIRLRKVGVVLLAASLLLSACRGATPSPLPEQQKTVPPSLPTQVIKATDVTSPSEAPPGEAPTAEGSTEIAPTPLPTTTSESTSTIFASFSEPEVEVSPSVQHEPIAPDLSNVYNPFVLSPEQISQLGKEGFVVTPGTAKEFFVVYESARYDNVPIFVTSDSLLHSYHLLFDKVLRTAEKEHFIPLLRDLNTELLKQVDAQYTALTGTEWEEAALRTAAFVGVASRLLDPSVEVPEYTKELVEAELALIEAADGIHPSPLFPFYENGEDYTQYIPRGHYTLSEELKAYFKSMMWYGRMTFRLKTDNPDAGRAETRSALLLAQALRTSQVNGRPALEAWADLYSPTAFFVGRSDDLTVVQYLQTMDEVYGPGASLEAVADETKLDQFIEAADKLPPPKILGMVISVDEDEEKVTKGMRFMGQRFVPDAYIFRQLIYRNVGTSDDRRGLPKGLDLLAAMGSERAYEILDEAGDTHFAKYPEQMEKMRTWLSGLTPAEWTETLYNSWIYSFYPLLEEPGEGYPAFMQSQSWLDKQLNTALGSWAELKHDTILYAKQVYAELGGGPPPPQPVEAKGYVEPVPGFFARLSALTAMTLEGLESRGLLTDVDKASLQRLEELTLAFQTMAEKELRGEPLTEEELTTIRFYGGDLEHFVMASADTDAEDPFAQQYMEEEPQAAVVADVATDPDPDGDGVPNPTVLEEAVGRIQNIHVVVPLIQDDGSILLQVAKGGVFSYYEFPWPAEDRLTDEKWRAMLDSGEAPELPDWTGSFIIAEGEYHDLQRGVIDYQSSITNLFWQPAAFLDENGNLNEYSQNLAPFQTEVATLKQNEQYIGRQLVSSNIISYDLQSPDLAVVTVREEWFDQLYNGDPYENLDAQPVSRRGPYSLEATYTLQRETIDGQTRWGVVSAAFANNPPEWEK